jgi:hypothetical protein
LSFAVDAKSVVKQSATSRALSYVAAFTIVIMYIASRLFSTEKILAAKLKLKLRAKKKQTKQSE